MNWNELKQFCDSLEEWQLEKPVIFFPEEEMGRRVIAETEPEDFYANPDEPEDCGSETEIKENIADGISDIPFELYELAREKGYPYLYEKTNAS